MNSLRTISPFRWNNLWVFDDPAVGLVREPFIAGADDFIEALSKGADQFTLIFSDQEFPGHQLHLRLVGRSGAGHTYEANGKEAWLCPALLLYFTEAPANLYAMAKALPQPKRRKAKHSTGSKADRLEAYGWHGVGEW